MGNKTIWKDAKNPEQMVIQDKKEIYSHTTEQMKITYKGETWECRDSEDNNGRIFYVFDELNNEWKEDGWLKEHKEMFENLMNYEYEIHN